MQQTRTVANQISMGRGLRRIVDMFYLPDELVGAKDRSLELIAEGKEHELTDESDTFTAPRRLVTN
jgi:hypothetical protein